MKAVKVKCFIVVRTHFSLRKVDSPSRSSRGSGPEFGFVAFSCWDWITSRAV
jgi:hypothetical protein